MQEQGSHSPRHRSTPGLRHCLVSPGHPGFIGTQSRDQHQLRDQGQGSCCSPRDPGATSAFPPRACVPTKPTPHLLARLPRCARRSSGSSVPGVALEPGATRLPAGTHRALRDTRAEGTAVPGSSVFEDGAAGKAQHRAASPALCTAGCNRAVCLPPSPWRAPWVCSVKAGGKEAKNEPALLRAGSGSWGLNARRPQQMLMIYLIALLRCL